MVRASVLVLVGVLGLVNVSVAGGDYPATPDLKMTPGSLCMDPDSYRYPEKIPYCHRAVTQPRKRGIFQAYIDLGFKIDLSRRSDFKIDHLIPLCAGGSNEVDNLWPEHVSIYTILDPIEPAICDKMQQGRLKQAHAVEIIRHVKQHPEEAEKTLDYVDSL